MPYERFWDLHLTAGAEFDFPNDIAEYARYRRQIKAASRIAGPALMLVDQFGSWGKAAALLLSRSRRHAAGLVLRYDGWGGAVGTRTASGIMQIVERPAKSGAKFAAVSGKQQLVDADWITNRAHQFPRVNRTMRTLLITILTLLATDVAAAQATNPRFGKWKLKSNAPAPVSNVMTYEPYGAHGMKVIIDAVNARGEATQWWYVTDFDGKDMPVTGNPSTSHSAVRTINDRINEIINKKDGKVTQVLTNVLSPDDNTVAVIYMRDDGAGHTTNVSFATYERITPKG
jgi:hypothetical protein